MINQRFLRLARAAALIASCTVGLAACEDGRVRPPSVSVRVVHAAPTSPPIQVFRGGSSRSQIAELDYRGVSQRVSVDEDQYQFNVHVVQPGGQTTSLAKLFTQQVSSGNDYLIVLTEVGGLIEPIVVETPLFDSTDATEVLAVHAAPGLDPMDVYLEPPGTDLATATPLGEIAFGEQLPAASVDADDYRLSLTASGDPATVLFSSGTFTLEAGDSSTFVVFDDAGEGLAPLSVAGIGTSAALLYDRGVRSGVQVVNAAADEGERDVFLDEDYTAAIVAALPYAGISDLATVPPGSRTLTVTPAANPGVVEDDIDYQPVRGQRYTAVIAGAAGDVTLAVGSDDNRRIVDTARVRFMNGASQFSPMEFFLVPPGTDVSGFSSTNVLAAPGVTQRNDLPPGDYELVLRNATTRTVVAGPEPITVGAGIYTILALDGTGGTAEVVLLEDFN